MITVLDNGVTVFEAGDGAHTLINCNESDFNIAEEMLDAAMVGDINLCRTSGGRSII